MEKTNISENLENVIIKLDSLQGITRVCTVAFQQKEAFAALNAEEVSNTFENINSQVIDVSNDLRSLLNEILAADIIK